MSTATMMELALDVNLTVDIKAKRERVFEGIIERFTHFPGDDHGNGMTFKLERWPGGRWYRDLGDDKGHLWGFVQSYRPPDLLEFFGPTCMSHPVAGHIIIRLAEMDGGTRVTFRHQAMGNVLEEHRTGMPGGWTQIFDLIKQECES